jgi:hypothetical protein
MRWRTVAGVVVASALLTGCGSGSSVLDDPLIDVVQGVQGGECFGSGSGGAFDITDEVPCTADHVWEVLGTVPLPPAYADAAYGDLLDSRNVLVDDVFHAGMRACVPMVAEWSGLTDALAGTEPFGPDALVWPGFAGNVLITATPERVWSDVRSLLCVVEWTDSAGAATPVASATEAPVIAGFADGDVPERRECRDLDAGDRYHPTSCADPHDAELLFTYDAAVHGADWVAGITPGELDLADWSVLDATCWAAGRAVFGAERTQTDLAIIADVGAETWGAGPFGADTHTVACLALPSDPSMLLDGPVWGLGDAPAALVPAA